MCQNYIIRPATLDDADFIVETIIGAEKSGTDKLGLSALFQLAEEELRPYLFRMLEEEIDGCEFSVSSFLLATCDGQPAAAIAGWIEGENEEELPSALLKANLLGYTFPPPVDLELYSAVGHLLKGVQIEREEGSYQIEYTYVSPEHRGRHLMQQLLEAHWEKGLAENRALKKMQVQAFANNLRAVTAYEKTGFEVMGEFRGDEKLRRYLPDHVKILLEKNV